MEPVPAARALVAELFPDALYAFLGGSALTGHRTSRSDLDVVVVLDGLAVPYRESLRWHDWPVDLLVHTELSLTGWADRDLAAHSPTLPRLCAEGVVLTDRAGRAAEVQAVMRERLSAGPGPAAPRMLDRARYLLSDLLDDLAGATDPGELAFIRWQVVEESARLALTSAGRWHGSGKWLLRELRAYDAALADELLSAHDDPVRLAATAGSVLERAGGRLWEGYRADGDPFHQRLRHIASGDLTSETAQSSGMHRLAAVSGRTAGSGKLWMGQTHVAPSTRSADHHHGESETAIYVISGTPSFVFLDPRDARETRLETKPGDYIFVPPYVPHREENADPEQEAVVVIARSTQDAIVVNLPDLSTRLGRRPGA
ncbi:cupin domain-containing protein [Nonomuraea sp. NPDC050022]|uniref:cupin domain-containing protein n=1 Tax=unclassified Nonomuraea TaxID=2593643 RepID=UPI00340D03D8